MSKFFIEENGVYKIDVAKSVWAIDTLKSIYDASKVELSDVDFIAETNENIYFIEYKNSKIPNAVNPNAFDPNSNKSISKIARKYYDSFLYIKAIGKNKPCSYIYVLEYPAGDTTTRKMIRNKIKTKLPFLLQSRTDIKSKLIEKFEVLSIDEWNNHPNYSQFPLSQVATPTT